MPISCCDCSENSAGLLQPKSGQITFSQAARAALPKQGFVQAVEVLGLLKKDNKPIKRLGELINVLDVFSKKFRLWVSYIIKRGKFLEH
jgi:hypothetical protein